MDIRSYWTGWLRTMREDQKTIFRIDPSLMGEDEIKVYVAQMAVALYSEVDELLREFTWKPWKKGWRQPDKQRVAAEIADILHFVAHLANVAGCTDDDINYEMNLAREKNSARMKGTYEY